MYQKIHLRLTLLCAGITAAIMVIMSLCYLHISETGLYRNQYDSFKNDMNTIITNLEQQSVISMEWLSKMESQGNYLFFVLDNNIPFLYNQLNYSPDKSRDRLLKESLDAYQSTFSSYELQMEPASPYMSYHVEFRFSSPSEKADYLCCVINIEKNTSLLQIIVLSPLKSLSRQIFQQRIRFALIDITAILLLGVFSFVFTGNLLKPVFESQLKQARFSASASHELRTPLAVILSAVECCKKTDPDGQKRFLNTIQQEGLRMSSLINDMLTLSESDENRFSIRKKPVELDTLLLNVYEAFRPLANEKFILLSIELPEDLFPLCVCDPDRISQVMSILLHNAISYTPEHGQIRLSLSLKEDLRKNKSFCLSVADNGPGISDEDKKKIFDRFYRAEKSRSAEGHFGLGLSIAYEIVMAHQGIISVQDRDGGGSIFTVFLPAAI